MKTLTSKVCTTSTLGGKPPIYFCGANVSLRNQQQLLNGVKSGHAEGGTAHTSTSKRAAGLEKIAQIEEIVSQLQEKHNTKYSVEKLNCWAHLILMKSMHRMTILLNTLTSREREIRREKILLLPVLPFSPGKRVNLCSECMDQLDKSLSLLHKGCITQERYDNLRDKILKDMSKF